MFMTYDAQPALRCGVCEQPILVAMEAVVVYPRGIEPGEMQPVFVTHEGDCRKTAQARIANPHGPGLFMELTEYGDRLRGKSDVGETEFL